MQISLQARTELEADKQFNEVIDMINLLRNLVSGTGNKVVQTWDLDHAVTVTARVLKANEMVPMTIDEALAFIRELLAAEGYVHVKGMIHSMWSDILCHDNKKQEHGEDIV